MSDSETELEEYKYLLEIKKQIANDELITKIEEACSDFIYFWREYMEHTDSEFYDKINHHLFSVKVYELIKEIFLN